MERGGIVQPELFHERIEDALDEVIRCCGGRKKFACELWPEKSPADAANHMNACLNTERRERLTPEQMLYILRRGRAVGCHAAMAYLAQECGYSTPLPVEPEDELAKQQREFVGAVKALSAMAARIEVLSVTTGKAASLRSVP